MNRKVLLIVISIVLLIAGAFAYLILSPPRDTPVSEVTDSSTKSNPETPTTVTNSQPGSYVEYSAETVLSTTGTKLLFFHAPWCPQCREMETSIEDGGVPSGVTVFKVDYDSNQALRQKHGVTLQTTFVKIDDQGNKIASYVAYEEPRFSSVERELLK